MSTMMPPLCGAPPHTRSRPLDAARTDEADGQRDDPFLATLRSALGTRDRHDTRSAAEHDRVERNSDGDDRPERDEHAPESRPAPHALDPPVTNGDAEETAEETAGATTGDPSATAAEDAPPPAVDPRPPDTPEWAEGRSGPPDLDPLHTPRPDTPAAPGPPGLDPLHTPRPDTPAAPGPPGLDPLHTPRPDTPAAPDLEPAEAGVQASQGSPASPPRDPSTVESAVDAAAMSEGDGATTDGATTVATSPAAGAPTTTGTSPGQGPAGASDPSADAFSGAGPAGGRTTTAPPGHERPAAPSAAPPSPAPSGTPDAEHVVRLSELAHAARATVRRSGPSSMRVQLHPAELGTVEVEVRLDDDGLQMVLRAERHHGAERLASNLDQLRRGLEREGLQLTDIEVSVGTSDRDTDLRGDTAPRDADDDPARSDEDAVDRTNPSTGARRRGSVTHRSEHRLTIEL